MPGVGIRSKDGHPGALRRPSDRNSGELHGVDPRLVVIGLGALVVVVIASVFSRRTGVATPLLLLVFGVAASNIPGVPVVRLEPEWILSGVLPPLLYADAVRLPLTDLRRNIRMITWLSVVLVIVTALAIGVTIHLIFPDIPIALAIALGAVVSPTDAIAATAIGHRMGLPGRTTTILEGESLLNDASALVILKTAIAALAGGFSLMSAGAAFVWAVIGASLVGAAIGWAAVAVRTRLHDPVLISCISFAVPFVAYFPAEEIGSSGVLAVVVAGLVAGARGRHRLPARARQVDSTNWTTIEFLLQSAVFLLMGMQLPNLIQQVGTDGADLFLVVGISGVTLAIMLVVRVVGLLARYMWAPSPKRAESIRERLVDLDARLDEYEPDRPLERHRLERLRKRIARGHADIEFERKQPITGRDLVVLSWSGMRGVVTLAAAMTIPHDAPHYAVIVLVAFTVAAFTLLVFGGTLPWLIDRLAFEEVPVSVRRREVGNLLEAILDAAVDNVGHLEDQMIDGERIDAVVIERVRFYLDQIAAARDTHQRSSQAPDVREQATRIQRRYLSALRDALYEEQSIGTYSSRTYDRVTVILDREEGRLDSVGRI